MLKLADKVQAECFLCRRIIEKLIAAEELSEAEHYHISVDLAAIDNLRRKTAPAVVE